MHYGAVARRLHAERGGFAFLPGSLSCPADGTPTLRPHGPSALPTREQLTSHRRGISVWGRVDVCSGFVSGPREHACWTICASGRIIGMLFRQRLYPTRRGARVAPRRWVHENDACPVVLLGTRQILLHPPNDLVFGSGQTNDLIELAKLVEPRVYGGHPAEELGQSGAGVRKAVDVIGVERIRRPVRRWRIRCVPVDGGLGTRRARANPELCVVVAHSQRMNQHGPRIFRVNASGSCCLREHVGQLRPPNIPAVSGRRHAPATLAQDLCRRAARRSFRATSASRSACVRSPASDSSHLNPSQASAPGPHGLRDEQFRPSNWDRIDNLLPANRRISDPLQNKARCGTRLRYPATKTEYQSSTSLPPKTHRLPGISSNGANRDRTGDLLLAKQALSQLSYGPRSPHSTGS